MKGWKVFFCLSLVLLLCFTFSSCRTTTEYVPVPVDITDVVNPVLEQRPDNTKITVKADITDWSYDEITKEKDLNKIAEFVALGVTSDGFDPTK